ncbi:MAG: peptidoglycan D,D-transpeptidase FtsI family protein [Alphaproteobacteria bacterium]
MKKLLKKHLDNIGISKNNFNFGMDIPLSWVKIKRKKNIIINRLNFILFFIYLIFTVIILRTLSLSINLSFFEEKNYNTNSQLRRFSRPDITDRNGELLAVNLPTLDLYVEPHKIIYPERTASELVKILTDLKYDDVLKKIKSDKKFVYLDRKISPSEREKLLMIGEPALGAYETDYRFYPQSNLFPHIIGNIDIDNRGTSGIEKYIDDNDLTSSKNPIVLSVDIYIQDAIRQNLTNAMKNFKAKSAAGIVMDVKTGEILGMVSLPDFHNNDAKKIISSSLYNNHITLDVYEIGSVMKIFNTALALENNYPKDRLFDVSKPFMIGNFRVKDSHPKKWKINMEEAFIYSSNIASAMIAMELGEKKQTNFFKKLGFFSKMNFELPERGFPIFPKKWNDNVNATSAYGYGISISLLHTISAVNAIINDGMYVNPTLIKRDKNKILKSYQVVNSKTSYEIKKLMRLVITDGTGVKANLKSIKAGGKTGTALKLVDGKYNDKILRTFFVSIFPIEDPKYTMLIMLDEANNNGCVTSACTTVPVSAKIIEEIIPKLNLN